MTSALESARAAGAPTPVTILAGFLGAGKTTLLKRLLEDPKGVRFGVVVNDFGAVNIDAALIAQSAGDQVTLENGCVCCSIRDDLAAALDSLLAADPPPERIVIEASGVSRPLPIADALEDEGLRGRVALDGVFCLIDGANFRDLDFESTELALEQAAGADIVLLNKIDVAAPETLAAIETTLRGPLPRMRLVRTRHAEAPRALLFGPRDAEPSDARHARSDDARSDDARSDDARSDDARSDQGGSRQSGHDGADCADDDAHRHHHHADAFESWSWAHDGAVDENRLRAAIRALPTDLLRMKGVLRAADDAARLVFHQVGKRAALTREAGPAPAVSRLVAIARRGGLDPAALTAQFDACRVVDAAAGATAGANPASDRGA